MNETARATITQQLRAQLQEMTFNTNSSSTTTNVFNLSGQTYYYDYEGISTNQAGYYQAKFQVNDASIPSTTSTATNYFQAKSAQLIKVTLSYPATVSPAPNTNIFYIFAAKQKSN